MKLAGIEIGGTKLQIVVGNDRGEITDRVAHTIDATQGAKVIRSLVEKALRKFGKVDGIGVGFGGPVNRETGQIWTSYHVEGWTGFNIREWLLEKTKAKVIVENDANVAALGEAVAGAGKDQRVVAYITLGSGVGGGLVIGKQIYHGRIPGEVEFGHIQLEMNGRTVQDSCSGWAVNEKIKRIAIAKPEGKLTQLAAMHKGQEAKALVEAIDAGDNDAAIILNQTVIDLSFGLSHLIHLLHPDTIIIGGGLSFIGERLRKGVEISVKQFILDAFQPGPIIRLSSLKADAVPVGALILAGQYLKSSN